MSLNLKIKDFQDACCEQPSHTKSALGFDWSLIMLAIQNATRQKLTRREIECLYLWLNGFSIKGTARSLDNISIRTVQTFRENIKRKLKVKTYQELNYMMQVFGLMHFFLQT
jgi:DNA-binding CsgD family transcriptional regulator